MTQVDYRTHIRNLPIIPIVSTDYAFSQAPAQTLTPGSILITMNPLPPGINAGSVGQHTVRISDSVSGSENMLITGVTGSQISGVVTLTHTSGNWSIISASNGIQEAIQSLQGELGGSINIPSGAHTVWTTVKLVNSSATNIGIFGDGGRATQIFRGSTFTSGDIFSYDSSVYGLTKCVFTGMKINNGQNSAGTYLNVTSGYAIHTIDGGNFTAWDVEITNGKGGIFIDNSSVVFLSNIAYGDETPYAAVVSAESGLKIEGHVSAIYVDSCKFFGQDVSSANNLFAGILIRGADGIQICNCESNGRNGIVFQGGFGDIIANVYIVNCILDNIAGDGVHIGDANTPHAYNNIRVLGCHIAGNTGGYNTTGVGVNIGADVDNVLVIGNNIYAYGLDGITIGSGNNTNGVAKKSIIISNNDIWENNLSNGADGQGIRCPSGQAGVSIVGNTITNQTGAAHQKYGIQVINLVNSIISDNNMINMETGGLSIAGTVTGLTVGPNGGVDDVIPTVASGASITIAANPLVKISGTTPITTLSGGWPGRRVSLLFTNAAPGGVGTGGNILRTQAAVQNQKIVLEYDGTNWY